MPRISGLFCPVFGRRPDVTAGYLAKYATGFPTLGNPILQLLIIKKKNEKNADEKV